jgi:hypothetical protein
MVEILVYLVVVVSFVKIKELFLPSVFHGKSDDEER